jgi:site-specific DNA recombinase
MIAKPNRAVTYCRMSGDRQEESIPRQFDEIKKYAERNGYKIVRQYADEGMSGDATDRTGFNKLIRDAERKGDFDVILVWDQNRFSRFDTITANHYWYILREAGVSIVSVNQGEIDFDDLGNMLVATIEQHSANKFLKDLGRLVCSGLKRAVENGHHVGRVPFGYRLAGDRLEIDDENSVVVRSMFDAVLNRDVGVCTLARELTLRGVPTPDGKAGWHVTTIKLILTNLAYTGTKIYGKVPSGKHCRILSGEIVPVGGARGERQAARQAASDCIVKKGAYPVIIDGATFTAVQEILNSRAKPSRTRAASYLLSGCLWCGECGKPCFGSKAVGTTGRPYFYYRCGSRKNGGVKLCGEGCRYMFRRERIEALVKHYINTTLLTDEKIKEFADWQRRHIEEIRGDAASRVKTLERRLAAAKSKLERLEGRVSVAPDDMVDMLYRQVRATKEQRDGLAMELSAAESLAAKTAEAVADAGRENVERLTRLRKLLHDPAPDVARRAYANIVDKVVVFTKPRTNQGPGSAGGTGTRELDRLEVTFRRDVLSNEHFSLAK